MKRVVARVKRKQAGTGAKRKAPRQRSATKTATIIKTRRTTTKPGKTAKVKVAPPRRSPVAKRRIVRRKPRVKSAALATNHVETELTRSLVPGKKTFRKATLPAAAIVATIAPAKARRSTQRKTATVAVAVETPGFVTKRKTVARRPPLKIPPILLEGDEPDLPAISGPGEKFSLGPDTPAAHFATEVTHLPATYGTGRLFLTARDPHWLYAHWDINTKVQFQHNARSVDRHLILRMHEGDLDGKPAAEIHVHPESRHWFAHVEQAGTQFIADLGYYQTGRNWKSLATSAPMRTPPDTISADSTVEFATIPLDLPFETMLSLLKEGEERKLPLAHAIQQLRDRRLRDLPAPAPTAEWTPEQERALAEILASAQGKPALRGSEESSGSPDTVPSIESLPAGLGPFGLSSSLGEYISSPQGGAESMEQTFWFKVNAELIIYGSTEPGAKVSVGGKPITLQPDGSFNYRFALPDGKYELPVVAVSADATDGRAAQLKFTRTTEVFGDVSVQPQDPALKPPTPEAI